MRTLYQIGFAGWLLGTVLIVLGWMGVVPPLVGWTGFSISLICAMFTWVPSTQKIVMQPLSPDAAPVAATGVWVQTDSPLEPGSRVLAFSQGSWWRARVISLEGKDRVRVNFVGWDPRWEESHRRSQLQLDEDLEEVSDKPEEPPKPEVKEPVRPQPDYRFQRPT